MSRDLDLSIVSCKEAVKLTLERIGEWQPIAFIQGHDKGHRVETAVPLISTASGNPAADAFMLREVLKRSHAEQVVTAIPAWGIVSEPTADPREIDKEVAAAGGIEKDPRRTELVVVHVSRPNGWTCMWIGHVTRESDDKAHLTSWEIGEGASTYGELFPPVARA